MFRHRDGDLLRHLGHVVSAHGEVIDVEQRIRHRRPIDADGEDLHALSPELAGNRQREFLPTPVRVSRRLGHEGKEKVDLGDRRGDALDERVADLQLPLVDPDSHAPLS